MKGMQKIKRGKCFSGIIHYALKSVSHHKTVPRVIGGNMLGSSTTELIDEFNTAKKLREDIVKPVWHNSLRLPKMIRLQIISGLISLMITWHVWVSRNTSKMLCST